MKPILKAMANRLAQVLVAPLALIYALSILVFGAAHCLPGFAQAMSLLPGTSGAYLRRAFYGWVLPRVGSDAYISFGVLLTSHQTSIGERAYIGPYSVLGNVIVEDDVLIASHVSIINGGRQHGTADITQPIREQTGEFPQVTIGHGSWIGERAVIMADVGPGTIVGAGAVVTRPLPANCVAVGVPARIVSTRSESAEPKVDFSANDNESPFVAKFKSN